MFPSFWYLRVSWFLFRTRAGLALSSVGDNHHSAHALGINVIAVRYLAVMFGGACSGLAGAYLSLVYVPQWVEGMTAGRGWIALALVVFASWRPIRVPGAYLFGAIPLPSCTFRRLTSTLFRLPQRLYLASLIKATAFTIPVVLPYIATIVVLVLISRNRRLTLINTPATLGQGFVPDR